MNDKELLTITVPRLCGYDPDSPNNTVACLLNKIRGHYGTIHFRDGSVFNAELAAACYWTNTLDLYNVRYNEKDEFEGSEIRTVNIDDIAWIECF